jgi:hypothetical protein
MLKTAGFCVDRVIKRSFTMRYADGAALLEHPFIRLAFLDPWRAVPRPEDVDSVMAELGGRLDEVADREGELALAVAFACFDAHRA